MTLSLVLGVGVSRNIVHIYYVERADIIESMILVSIYLASGNKFRIQLKRLNFHIFELNICTVPSFRKL